MSEKIEILTRRHGSFINFHTLYCSLSVLIAVEWSGDQNRFKERTTERGKVEPA